MQRDIFVNHFKTYPTPRIFLIELIVLHRLVQDTTVMSIAALKVNSISETTEIEAKGLYDNFVTGHDLDDHKANVY